jgi:hypothetical protein
MSRAGTVIRSTMQREDKIYMAYKVRLTALRRAKNPTAVILAQIYTAKAFHISLFTMIDIVKRRGRLK